MISMVLGKPTFFALAVIDSIYPKQAVKYSSAERSRIKKPGVKPGFLSVVSSYIVTPIQTCPSASLMSLCSTRALLRLDGLLFFTNRTTAILLRLLQQVNASFQ